MIRAVAWSGGLITVEMGDDGRPRLVINVDDPHYSGEISSEKLANLLVHVHEVQAEHRLCTTCNALGRRNKATHVVTATDGLQWYECGQHEGTVPSKRDTWLRTPIDEWWAKVKQSADPPL